MKAILALVLFTIALTAQAGNGVERGSVMIKGYENGETEILNYLKKKLSRCESSSSNKLFEVKSHSQREERVDNGIIDVYYQFRLRHLDEQGQVINDLEIEILDSDFDNWREYEEKLSIEIVKDKNKLCN